MSEILGTPKPLKRLNCLGKEDNRPTPQSKNCNRILITDTYH